MFSKKKTISAKKKLAISIPDMESNGVYFSEDQKIKLQKTKEESICHYSGLPSINSYK